MEEYICRLESGCYTWASIRHERAPHCHGISLFPQSGPNFSRNVRHGVEVTVSLILMPEHSQNSWGYSVSLQLQGSAAERGFERCQLHERSWIFREDGQDPVHV